MTFLQQLADAILQRSDIPLKDTLIVLPNKRARRMLQKELAIVISQPCFSPTIFSIDEFIHKLSDYTLCDDIDLLHILFQAYRNFEHAREEKLASFLSWAETFIHDISEIDMQLADASQIFGNLSDIKELETVFGRENLTASQQRYLQFYATLHGLYATFNQLLNEKKKAYEGKIYKDTADHIVDYAPKFNFKRYLFAGFQTLSPSEMKIVQYYHQEHQAELYFDIDTFYQNNYTPFINILQNKLRIKELEWIHTDYSTIPKEINMVGASKSMTQILYAIEQLNRIEAEEGSLNNTVLVFADEKLLIPFLHCYDCGKANLTMGYPLAATPAYALLSILMETAKNSHRFHNMQQGDFLYYHRDVFSFFNNPLIINYLFQNSSSNAQFLKELTRLNSIFFPLETLSFHGHDFPDLSGSPVSILERILQFFTLLSSQSGASEKTNTFDSYCLQLITEKLQQALERLQDFDPHLIDLESVVFILNSLIQRISIPLKGSPSEGLQIMGLLETRALDFKNVIMLSVNEGVLPAGKSANSLILHEVKRHFNLPTYQEKDTVYGYHFFRLLQRAERIELLYNTDSEKSLAEKSRFLKQLDFEVKAQQINNISIREWVLPTTVNTHQQQQAVSIRKTDSIIRQLLDMEYSYSQLNDYLNCPLQFYLKHVARIEASEEISENVEQNIIGDAVHQILHQIGQQLIQNQTDYKKILTQYVQQLDPLVQEHVRRAILQEHDLKEQGRIHLDLAHGKTYLATEVVKKAVGLYLKKLLEDYEYAEANKQLFNIIATEQKLTCPISADGHELRLKGYADRIDYRNGHVTLLDYKTGYVDDKGLVCKDFDDIFSGTQHKQLLQLLMYAYLYDRVQGTGYSDQGTDNKVESSESGIQNSEFKIQNSNKLSTETCQLKPDTYACGIISFQRLYKNEPHELYPIFQLSGGSDQGEGNRIQNSEFRIQNSSPQKNFNFQLSTFNSENLITPEILQLFESHLINLLRDIINPDLPFCQTDDVNHCDYCDYSAICKRQHTQDE
ncbi:MAG: PD-(D/E)XK nuclease family protein [Bacteroidales bacterium]|nr:PD-(D/E)XK nuclease family protein [Bacteroidales bacterium]